MHSLDRGLSRIVGGGKPPMQQPEPGPLVVTCPTCRGRAHAEQDPVTVTRGGVQAVVRYATCKCGCQMPSRRGAGARQTTIPLRFEVSADQIPTKPEEITMEKKRKHRCDRATEEQLNDTRARVRNAMGLAEITAPTLARSLSINTSTLYNFLNGRGGLALEANDRLNVWAEEVEATARKPLAEKAPEPEGSFSEDKCGRCGLGDLVPSIAADGFLECSRHDCHERVWIGTKKDDLPIGDWISEPEPSTRRPQELHLHAEAERTALAATALEEWACAKLAYAMEGAGFRLPAGLRWRVSVERE